MINLHVSQEAVHNIENCQPNRSAMERSHSGGTAYVIDYGYQAIENPLYL